MRARRWWGDPVFVIGCAAYVLNRWVLVPRTGNPFLKSWFDDLLLVPCALPVQLAIYRWTGLRRGEGPPTGTEVLVHLVFWSLLFEVFGPHIWPKATGDPRDVLAYAAGAIAAYLHWRRVPARLGEAADAGG